MPTVTSFEIEIYRDLSDDPLVPSQLLAGLRCMPALTSLTLLGVLRRHSLTVDSQNFEVLELQHLAYLHLMDDAASLLWYLERLGFPSKTNLHLEVTSMKCVGDPDEELFSFSQKSNVSQPYPSTEYLRS